MMEKIKSSIFNGLLLTLLALIFGFSSYAQGSRDTLKWKFSNPKQFGFTVFDLDYYDDNHAIAVGAAGGIAVTSNGGSKWTYGAFVYTSPDGLKVRSNFNDVHFVTSTIGYAVGTGGCMAKTTNAGQTWEFITTPLFQNNKNINAVWFVNKDTGYIGGQYNSADSIPKLYYTRNGGISWDSLNAPIGGKTVVGYVSNPSLSPEVLNIDSKGTEIYRIQFSNETTGYISGGAYSFNTFPRHAAVGTDCLPNGQTIATSANFASLVWKLSNGVLTDYSLSKERLGYTGINTTAVTCNTRFGQIQPQTQVYRALNVINDSTIVLMSFNNNIVVKVMAGVNDSTLNINVPNYYENGRYEVLNFPFPPNGGTPIPPPGPNVLNASNPYHMISDASGKLYAPCNFGQMWTSVDTGRNWINAASLPQGYNFSSLGTWAMDITPSGKFVTMGTNGVTADSLAGTSWTTTYESTPLTGSYFDMEFTDCNNGIAVGGASITVTNDGGNSWIDKVRSDFASLFISITSVSFPALDKAWFSTNVGNLYLSPDQGTTLNPVFSDANYQLNEIASKGPDSVWVIAFSSFSVPGANRSSSLIRSFDGGATWQTFGGFPVGTTAPNLRYLSMPTATTGFAAGTRNGVFKTTDGGSTWTDISPFPVLNNAPVGFPNASVNYTDLFALDSNTVFICGNMFTDQAVKRVYKTTDGGATWVDITSNIPQINPIGNLNAILMHDQNNGYVVAPGGVLMYTNDGGTTWNLDLAPVGSLFETMAFAPKKVPAGVLMENRKLFVCGANVNTGAPMMEYGDPAKLYVSSEEQTSNASCTNVAGGTVTINPTGGIAPYEYSVNGGAFQSSNIFTGLAQGTDTITIRDQSCQEVVKIINIGFDDNLTLDVSNDTSVCAGASLQLSATGPATNYTWTPSAGLSDPNVSNPTATINAAIIYTVTAELNGCERTESVNIGLSAGPAVSAGADQTILAGESVLLNGTSSSVPQSILWSPATSLTGFNTLTPTAAPLTTTTYTLNVTDANGCSSSDEVVVNVIEVCIKIMDAFTPNGDGFNERWMVTGASGSACTKRIDAAVYNRYGNLIYRNDNYQNNWDGTYKGNPVPDGTYYYVLKFTLINGKTIQKKGSVTVLR